MSSDVDSAPETPEYERRVLEALRRIARSIDLHSRQVTAAHGVTTPQLIALLTLDRSGSLVLSELSRRIHLSPSTVVGIVDRLEKRDLVRRRRSETDRRRVHVELTDTGRELVRSAPSPLHERLRAGLATLSELEQLTLAAALERVVDLMEIGDLDAAPLLTNQPLA